MAVMTSIKIVLALAAVLLVPTSDIGRSPEPTRRPPMITFVGDVAPHDREIVEWAVNRFAEAGLQLPDLTVSFPVTCNGRAGQYFVGQSLVELCTVSKKLALHEFAHAWDDNVSLDRDAFMERRGIDHWYESDGPESGGEQLAKVIAWGLLETDTTWPASEYAGQPFDERPRRLIGVPDADREELATLFTSVVGVEPLTPIGLPD